MNLQARGPAAEPGPVPEIEQIETQLRVTPRLEMSRVIYIAMHAVYQRPLSAKVSSYLYETRSDPKNYSRVARFLHLYNKKARVYRDRTWIYLRIGICFYLFDERDTMNTFGYWRPVTQTSRQISPRAEQVAAKISRPLIWLHIPFDSREITY